MLVAVALTLPLNSMTDILLACVAVAVKIWTDYL